MRQNRRTTVPRGLIAGTVAVLTLVWGIFAIDPARGITSPTVQSAIYLALFVLTAQPTDQGPNGAHPPTLDD